MPASSKILIYSLILVINALLSSCSNDDPVGPAISDIPQYPNSMKGESMQQSMLGMASGALQQYSTDDDFRQVFSFYEKALSQYTPEIKTYDLESGRQSALSIEKENGGITVAIQEYPDEGKVVITFMEVSR